MPSICIRAPTVSCLTPSNRPAGPGAGEGKAGKRPRVAPVSPPRTWAPRLPAHVVGALADTRAFPPMPASGASQKGDANPAKRGKTWQQVGDRSAGSADIESPPAQLQRAVGRVTQKGGIGSNAPVPRQGKGAAFDAKGLREVIQAVEATKLGSGGWNARVVPEEAAAPRSSETKAVAEEAAVPEFSENGVTEVLKAVEAVGGGRGQFLMSFGVGGARE